MDEEVLPSSASAGPERESMETLHVTYIVREHPRFVVGSAACYQRESGEKKGEGICKTVRSHQQCLEVVRLTHGRIRGRCCDLCQVYYYQRHTHTRTKRSIYPHRRLNRRARRTRERYIGGLVVCSRISVLGSAVEMFSQPGRRSKSPEPSGHLETALLLQSRRFHFWFGFDTVPQRKRTGRW